MTKVFIAICIVSVIASCENLDKHFKNDKNNEAKQKEKKITTVSLAPIPRDVSITPENSYNDLFLDSTAVEFFITENKINDSIAKGIRNFYNARNYQFAWLSSDGLTEQGRGFWNLQEYINSYEQDSTLKNKKLQKRMDSLVTNDSLTVNADSFFTNTELSLTQHFVYYTQNNTGKGYVNREAIGQFMPIKKVDALSMTDSILTDSILNKQDTANSLEQSNEPYKLLKIQLSKFYSVAKQGGFPSVPQGVKNLKKGVSSPTVTVIKKRLQLTGEMPGDDTSKLFNESLEYAIKSFQQRHGFTPNGIVSDTVVEAMNVSVNERIQQLLINMNRLIWTPAQMPENVIEVNIPEFMLHVYEGKNKLFDMEVVVGKEGTNTMMFTGELNQIVFSPYWNIPASIVKGEILPAMKKNPGYLKRQNMEIVSETDSLPVIRQLPGPQNSLGKVKFLFPNTYDIYFHDTPDKTLFKKTNRAFSHGCIRLADAEKMATYLLRNHPEWTPAKIREAMNSGKENYVKLKNPVAVSITYFTAWIDNAGELNFRKDVYGHDKNLTKKMFN
jgi:murein L,D-transpeptidase YcbB/YkuD